MANKDNGCPVCKSRETASIRASGLDSWTSLLINRVGSICLSACLNCGCVYLDEMYIKRIKETKGGADNG